MTKLPDKLNIMGHEYGIIFPHAFLEREDAVGLHCYQTSEIYVSGVDCNGNDRAESKVWATLIHEILHAINASVGGVIFTDEEKEEQQVETLANCLYQVFNDNGLLNKGEDPGFEITFVGGIVEWEDEQSSPDI